MRLNPSQLAGPLARGLAPFYVVGGEEPLLIEESLDAIRAAARKQGYSEREILEVEPGFDWQRLVESLASLSLFASQRLIELRMPRGIAPGRRRDDDHEDEDAPAGGGGSGAKILTELAQKPAPDTVLLVICGKLEWRTRQTGWFAALEQAGASVYAEAVKPDRLPAWLQARLKRAGLEADAEALELLAQRTEGHLLAAAQDVEKLKLLYGQVGEGRIGVEQVRTAVADSAHFEAFDLNDKILAGDAGGVAHALQRLREEGEELPKLLGALTYDLRCWIAAAEIYARSRDAPSACQAAKVRRNRQSFFIKGLTRATLAQVLGWLARCGEIDALFKRGAGEAAWEELLTCSLAASGVALLSSPDS